MGRLPKIPRSLNDLHVLKTKLHFCGEELTINCQLEVEFCAVRAKSKIMNNKDHKASLEMFCFQDPITILNCSPHIQYEISRE